MHIHLTVHIDKKTTLTTQLWFDDTLNNEVNSKIAPYSEHTGRDTGNDDDSIIDVKGGQGKSPSRRSARVSSISPTPISGCRSEA